METKFQTSFIPKQPVTSEAPHRASATSLFFLFAFIIFMASLASAGGVFIYGEVIKKNINDGKEQLTLNKNAFDPNTISQITRLNDRINAADYLLKRHKSVSTLFLVLSNSTLKNVRFSDFNYSGIDDKITLGMKGQATSYETVALQAKEFTNPNLKNVFRSPLFGDLTLDTQGNVSFTFTTNVDPVLVDYYKLKKEEYAANGDSASLNSNLGTSASSQSGSSNERGFVQTNTDANLNSDAIQSPGPNTNSNPTTR
ncbi:MAG: hypothetical protein K9M11_02740 [Candidatus Pacebacteria bacterium]|nr:hypothetical protein [Candidatus Paceibacterota bacterium]